LNANRGEGALIRSAILVRLYALLLICPFPFLLGITGLPLWSFFSLDVPLPCGEWAPMPAPPCLQGLGGCDTSRGHVVSGFRVGHNTGCIIVVTVRPGSDICVFLIKLHDRQTVQIMYRLIMYRSCRPICRPICSDTMPTLKNNIGLPGGPGSLRVVSSGEWC
jgi:hypothetical protein